MRKAVLRRLRWLLLGVCFAAPSWAQEMVTLDFQQVELGQVVRFIAEMTGRNYIVSDKVKGNVTVVTPTPVTKEEAFKLFEGVLSVHGFTIIDGEGADQIVPDKDARVSPYPIDSGMTRPDKGLNVLGKVVRLKNVDANSAAATLKPLLSPWGYIGSNVGTNALIMTDTASNIEKLMALIEVMDAEESKLVQRAFVVKHANAAHVEKLLTSVYTDFNSRRPKGVPGMFAFSDPRTNTLLVIGPEFILGDVAAIVHRLDQPTESKHDNLHLYYPKNNKAAVISKVLNELVGKLKTEGNEFPVSFAKQVSVVADEESNALVVSATKADYEILLPIIQGLDVRRRQVYIEAAILEVSDERVNEFGVDWRFATDPASGGSDIIGGSSFGRIAGVAANPLALSNGLTFGVVEGTITDPNTGLVLPNISALVTALRSDNDVNVLSTPNLLVLENEEAEISVGQNVPFVTGNQTSDGGNVLQTIERKDVGLVLRVTPRILSEGEVVLDIFNEISSIAQTVAGINTEESGVVTNKRSIVTSVMLENEQTIVLGGLISEESNDTVQRVPVLGSLPVLGHLFRSTARAKIKQNLMIFLRPVVINSYEEILNISRSKYNFSRETWEQEAGYGGGATRPTNGYKIPVDINQLGRTFELREQEKKTEPNPVLDRVSEN